MYGTSDLEMGASLRENFAKFENMRQNKNYCELILIVWIVGSSSHSKKM